MRLNLNLQLLLILTGASFIFALSTGFLLLSVRSSQRQALPIVDPAIQAQQAPESVKEVELPILRVEPGVNQEDVSTLPKIVVTFRNSVSGKKVEAKVTPAFEFRGSFDRSGTILTIYPSQALKPKTAYSVEILVEGSVVYGWRFTTGEEEVTSSEVASINKLKQSLPYQGLHFSIEYKSISDKFFVYIDAKPMETYRTQALNYFRSQGISEPSKLNISIVPVGNALDP